MSQIRGEGKLDDPKSMDETKQTKFLKVLEALRAASKDIETNSDESSDCNSPSMNALLELETGSDDLFAGDPKLTILSSLLFRLKSLAASRCRRRRRRRSEISRIASSIGSELQSWIDRKSIDRLVSSSSSDEEKANLLAALESRLSQGFDRDLQDFLLKSGAFHTVESLLANLNMPNQVRDRAAMAILAFVRFNKDVFVGEVLMGPTVRSLLLNCSATSLRVLNGLISLIRSPIVDQLHADGAIPKIIDLLSSSSSEAEIRILAFETVLEIGYYGGKQAIDAMLELGLIKKLVQLQRSELGGSMMEAEAGKEERLLEDRPFASCVSRFSIQLEVGEGLRNREKRELKIEVVKRVREAACSEVEAATIVAEVLWGSTGW